MPGTYWLALLGLSPKAYPATTPSNTAPKDDRNNRCDLSQHWADSHLIRSYDPVANCEGEDDRHSEETHLCPERIVVVALDRFRQKQQHTSGDGQHHAPGEPGPRTSRQFLKICCLQYEPEDPEMLAVHAVALLQQWYLKRWKFKRLNVSADQFAGSVLSVVLKALDYQDMDGTGLSAEDILEEAG